MRTLTITIQARDHKAAAACARAAATCLEAGYHSVDGQAAEGFMAYSWGDEPAAPADQRKEDKQP